MIFVIGRRDEKREGRDTYLGELGVDGRIIVSLCYRKRSWEF